MTCKPMDKAFCLLAFGNQGKPSSFVLLVFYSQPSSCSLCFLSLFYFFFSPHSVFYLLSLFTLLLCFLFFLPFFPRSVNVFFVTKGWKKSPCLFCLWWSEETLFFFRCLLLSPTLFSFSSQGGGCFVFKRWEGLRLSSEGLDLGFFSFMFPSLFSWGSHI